MRPPGLTLIAILHWFRGAIYAVVALAVLGVTHLSARLISAAASDTFLARLAAGMGKTIGLGLLVLALIWIVLGFGIWATKSWARTLTLVFVGILLLWHLISLTHMPTPWHFVRVLVDAAIIVYLLLPDVKHAFVGGTRA
jgi:hypothetical protein